MEEDYSKKLLGQILAEQKKLAPEELERVLLAQKETKFRIGHQIINMGFVSEEDVLKALSLQLNVPYVHSREYPGLS